MMSGETNHPANQPADQPSNLTDIQKKLFEAQDVGYQAFMAKLIPTEDPARIIGVRAAEVRVVAGALAKDTDRTSAFLQELPHTYYEENQLHANLLQRMREPGAALAEVERFLPYVNNWAVCDGLYLKVFRKVPELVFPRIVEGLRSDAPYELRYWIGVLMDAFLEENFAPEQPGLVAGVRSEHYYVRMMQAWYFATALSKQYESAVPYLEQGALDVWTHNKAIQKSVESFRIAPETKEYLKTLRRKSEHKSNRESDSKSDSKSG